MKRKKKKGFTLIEVLLAMAILAISVLPILSMYPSALRMSTRATELEEWSRVTQTIVDYIKSRGYDAWEDTTSVPKISDISDIVFVFKSDGSSYQIVKESDNSKKIDNYLFALGKELLYINTKGMPLNNYKLKIEMKEVEPSTLDSSYSNINIDGGTEQYTYDFEGKSGKNFIHGIVKIRPKDGDFNTADSRDLNFIITPIDNWQ
jgi:prepilin-type N-terminal cleavage/methylation domain-containing protein